MSREALKNLKSLPTSTLLAIQGLKSNISESYKSQNRHLRMRLRLCLNFRRVEILMAHLSVTAAMDI